jgi:hypothetical protein
VVVEMPEQPPGYIAGVVEEHLDDDDMLPPPSPIRAADHSLVKMHVDSWKAEVQPYNGDMDIDGVDMTTPSRPQIGPGMSVRRVLQEAHAHEVYRLDIDRIPVYRPSDKDPIVENRRERTYDDIKAAIPGDRREWFFCPTCWAWMRIQKGTGLPQVDDMDLWEAKTYGKAVDDLSEAENDERTRRQSEMTTLALLVESRSMAKASVEPQAEHFHPFKRLLYREKGRRIERVQVEDPCWNEFPAVVSDLDELGQDLAHEKEAYPTLYMSCNSETYFIVSEPFAGQIPRGLANRLVEERGMNPRVGSTGHDALEAWELLSR